MLNFACIQEKHLLATCFCLATLCVSGALAQSNGGSANSVNSETENARFQENFDAAVKALKTGKFQEAESLLKETLKMESRQGASQSNKTKSILLLADLYKSQRRFSEAESLYKTKLAGLENVKDDQELTFFMSKLAALYKAESKYDESLDLYKRTLALVEKRAGRDSSEAATVHANMALLFQKMGRFKEAESEELLAIKLFEEKLGPESRELGQAKSDLGTFYMQNRNAKKAIPLLESALAILGKSAGGQVSYATCADELGTAYFSESRYAEAEELARKALAVYEKALGPKNLEVAVTLSNLGFRLSRQSKNQEAIESFKRSLSIQESCAGPFSPEMLANLHGLAEVYVSQADFSQSETVLRRSLLVKEKNWGPKNVALVPALRNLANCLLLQGKMGNESETLIKRAESILAEVPYDKRKAVEMLVARETVKGLDLSGKKEKKKDKQVW